MAQINSDGKVAYVYNQSNDTWYAIGAAVNTNAEYTWTADQTFTAPVTIESVVTAQAGLNNFQNPNARDTAISSPTNGIVCFIRQTNDGQVINQLQYYYNGSWKTYDGYASLSAKTTNYTLTLTDAGKTITITSADNKWVTIPANSSVSFPVGTRMDIIRLGNGEVYINPDTGVTLNSKEGNKCISTQYSGATLVKLDTNTWILVGDLKSGAPALVVD